MVSTVLVLISGSGSNLQSLIDHQLNDYKIIRVVSNKKDAYGLTRAKNAGIPTEYHNLVKYKKLFPQSDPSIKDTTSQAREAYDQDLAQLVLKDRPDLVVCAGFMHVLTPQFLNPLQQQGIDIINLHPSLPGAFLGTRAIERAFEAFNKGEITYTGVMIHYVIAEVDKGEPIVQRDVEMNKDDTLEDLQTRVHQIEHVAIVDGTRIAVQRLQERRKR